MAAKRDFHITLVSMLLLSVSLVHAAENDTVQAIIPWEADGRVYQVDTDTIMFIGAAKGVMYIETTRGELHEAFVMCPIIQKFNTESGETSAIGHCEITASPEDVAYAELTCTNSTGGCQGVFTLIDGEGKFAGISGSGTLRIRSPMRQLISNLAAGAELIVPSGLALVKDLEYRIP